MKSNAGIALRELRLDDCSLGDKGAAMVIEGLVNARCLEWLSMRRNGIGTVSLQALSVFVRVCRTISYIKFVSKFTKFIFASLLKLY